MGCSTQNPCLKIHWKPLVCLLGRSLSDGEAGDDGNAGEMVGLEELVGKELRFQGAPDPVVAEFNRLENQLKEKERELGVAHAEIRALKATEALKDKAVMELSDKLKKHEDKLGTTEKLLEDKKLEIKRLVMEKKEALAAQFAAEAALRRVHETQRDEDSIPLEAVIAPLESDIKMYKNEVAILQEDKRALERTTKSKEAALFEAEKILKSALERALIVENVRNENFELRRRIEIFQEENKILDKINRQKVLEVEKLTQTIGDLEESILAGGAIANVVRDHQRQVSELNEEKRTLERELARARVSLNRVATVVANEWKDDGSKVIPAKQWLEERRTLQGEIQRLHRKLCISERTAKAESQLKDKLRLRLKTLEEGLKHVSSLSNKQGNESEEMSELLLQKGMKRRSTSQTKASFSVLQQPNLASGGADFTKTTKQASGWKGKHASEEKFAKKNLWALRGKFFDDFEQENTERRVDKEKNTELAEEISESVQGAKALSGETKTDRSVNAESQDTGHSGDGVEDLVSGFLYDRLQKEVIRLRKSHEEKDVILKTKDEEFKLLVKKVEVLTRAMEVESKKIRRQSRRAREVQIATSEGNVQKNENTIISRRAATRIEDPATVRS